MEDVEMNTAASHHWSSNAIGFAAAASFVASEVDQETSIFRKFNKLSARNLIDMQNELLDLEERQEELDRKAAHGTDHILASAEMDYDDYKENLTSHPGLQERKKLQEEIEAKLDKYRAFAPTLTVRERIDLANTTQTMLSFGSAKSHIQKSPRVSR